RNSQTTRVKERASVGLFFVNSQTCRIHGRITVCTPTSKLFTVPLRAKSRWEVGKFGHSAHGDAYVWRIHRSDPVRFFWFYRGGDDTAVARLSFPETRGTRQRILDPRKPGAGIARTPTYQWS